MRRSDRIAISGIGVVGPGFGNVAEMDTFLSQGRTACRSIERFSTECFKSRYAFQVAETDVASDSDILDVRLPRLAIYGRQALVEALQRACLNPAIDLRECVLVFGTAVAGSWEMESAYGSLAKFSTASISRIGAGDAVSFSNPARSVFREISNREPVIVSTGCTAGLDALGYALEVVRDGANCAIVVAAEAPITPMVLACFEQIGALTKEVRQQQLASRPFSPDRSGFCLGEGAACVVLERQDRVAARRVKPLAFMRGFASCSSAYHMTAIHESGKSILASLNAAIADATVDSSQIDLISPHATSTPQNDRAEHSALQALFGSRLSRLPVFAGKASFGHALGASNLIETVAVIRMLSEGKVFPYPNRYLSRIEFDDIFLPDQIFNKRIRFAIKNSSGFSGIHSAAIFESS
ncbi:beta-ketoacyl-[acyl-carrier-protein] synthase family protein [Caballeronia sp. LZ035]|uniref:beta-ketoacyl-[acyl-carrier-protein] synthase family protein n=1 Tax=Caballeronia sp. LZ035 TaxID=3038568 RepID=UPI00285B022D|nr:beta-ketoacyl-[acyl-carrier-protein] synthase family protein [Caballeronia sp. LZ035]MDR5759694.1 beta-ketoacyl-[acyl-carrier-protein] synthase family protein [Caballeronia sp. LZ035]